LLEHVKDFCVRDDDVKFPVAEGDFWWIHLSTNNLDHVDVSEYRCFAEEPAMVNLMLTCASRNAIRTITCHQ
jgi:hypothetical protein